MFTVRPADQRGHGNHGWLDTRHSFSFADYHDLQHMGFRALRVMNEDRVQPEQGFGKHGHRDMEIITYVLSGELAHRDSLGNGSVLHPGELQSMTAGTGIQHSEFNASKTEPVHLYQIWILPERQGLTPAYEQRIFPEAERQGRLQLVASQDGRQGSLTVHQDAAVFLASLGQGQHVTLPLGTGRYAWLQVLSGTVTAGGLNLAAGDGLAVSNEPSLTTLAGTAAELMLFDLP